MFSELKIGILGGGQLGTMLVRHATDFGLNLRIMDKDPEAPCARYTHQFVCGKLTSYDDVMAFGEGLDVLTIEMEAVNTKALKALQDKGVKVYPTPETIDIIQDKSLQKDFLARSGMPVSPAIKVQNKEELYNHKDKLPAILKKCREGYDGYGVMMLKTEADIANAFDSESILEELVDIQQEIAVIVCRNSEGMITCYDPVAMVFDPERFILDYQVSPAVIEHEMAEEAKQLAIKIAGALQLQGILAVEMFVTADGKILVNEMAPRPHNSGHHTIEACATSQYEQLLRVCIGMPLGDTSLHHPSVMLNMLAKDEQGFSNDTMRRILEIPDAHMHWYGKKESRKGRKMGHITVVADTAEKAMAHAETIKHILNK